MLSFYPSPAHSHYYPRLYSARPVYADDDMIYFHPPTTSDYSYLPHSTEPGSHYRRAFAEYLVAEQELIRAREEARLRARVEALRRQEEARLLQARIIRARKERQVQRLQQVLARERAKEEVCCLHILSGSSLDTSNQGQPEHKSASRLASENGTSAPTLESLLQARLRKVASGDGDEEVQDLARATLDHLFRHTREGNVNDTSAISSEVGSHHTISFTPSSPTSFSQTKHDSGTQYTEGTDLSRSDALQGAAAEAAKASFSAHRAAQAAPLASKAAIPALQTIQDIRASLARLSADFTVPPSLDFSDDEADGLAYTPTNAPVKVYEYALEGLLARLDAVESDGDEEVRVARRTVVQEVEMALEGVEGKVKRAREVAQDASRSGEDVLAEASSSSFDLVGDEDTHTRSEAAAEAKAEEDEHSASIPSHNAAASYSSPAQVFASEVDVVSNTADSADVVPENSAIEDISGEEWTEVVYM